ncbi:hypothetical protein C900_05320 [Fulvivirga imtechensis AK7]|uniref:Uncharacterized protein n=1 Tax=Fulvivirga imtechensis AK7 TaxID=1237149 RepID=L8JP38_9BACT|nr:hypothetical protein [Fulvivirga imtechensis]ELR69249.1 hypothetical protein C900_05320 [Fulvivirga imtechensis AK7]
MELDELKRAWNTKSPKIEYTKTTLNDIFEIRTKRAVGKINRNMLWDAILMLIATAGFIVITFALGLKSRFMISGELILIATILGIHYRIKYLTINKFDFEDSGIGVAIRKVIKRLKGYIILYKILIPALSAVLYLLYCSNAYYYEYGSYSLSELGTSSIAPVLLITITCYLVAWKVTQIMYGQELKKLQELSNEFDTNP